MGSSGSIVSKSAEARAWAGWLEDQYLGAETQGHPDIWLAVATALLDHRPTLLLVSPKVSIKPIQSVRGGGAPDTT